MGRQQSSKKSGGDRGEACEKVALDPLTLKDLLAPGLERQFEKLTATSLAPGLYLVSTPIGNLADISVRALFALAAADIVFCEDTRHSRKLFSAYGLHKKLEAYHDFSGDKDRTRVLAALAQGKSVALISDAGTPLIADPGFKLVRGAVEEGFSVFSIPGPSAILAALVASGLPSDQFFFGGFLPPKDAARRVLLENLRAVPGTLIFYETSGRLAPSLEALQSIFPDRSIVIARELTKLYETFLRGSAANLLETIEAGPPIGECVLLIGPGEAAPATSDDIERALRNALKTGTLKEAVDEVATGLGAGRKLVYNLALKLRDKKP
jgi:16S rRNA (cytidine1402-2'-O)-methyltransferase